MLICLETHIVYIVYLILFSNPEPSACSPSQVPWSFLGVQYARSRTLGLMQAPGLAECMSRRFGRPLQGARPAILQIPPPKWHRIRTGGTSGVLNYPS